MAWYGDIDIFEKAVIPYYPECTNPFTEGLKFGQKNGIGNQYSGGDLLINFSSGYYVNKPFSNPPIYGTQSRVSYKKVRVGYNNTAAICIMLVPQNNFPNTNTAYPDGVLEKMIANKIITSTWMSPVLVAWNKSSYLETKYTTKNENGQYIDYNTSISFSEEIGRADELNITRTVTNDTGPTMPFWGTMDSFLKTWINQQITVNGVTLKRYQDGVINTFNEQNSELNAEYADWDIFLTSSKVSPAQNWFANLIETSQYVQGCRIASTIPIFMYDDLDGIYRYFKNGDLDSINKEELKLSDVGIATDWTIYVNGQRSPDITVTMNSKNIERYLEDAEENTGGYTKSDFKIEYEYPTYKIGLLGAPIMNPNDQAFKYLGTVKDKSGVYDNTRYSSWKELTDMNFTDKYTQLGDMLDGVVTYSLYAQLNFRIKLNDEIFSSWCYFNIGYIGSPSVTDFASMKNAGGVLSTSVDDGSTVTIIYDELPPDEDDYETPDDDFPDPDETAPSGYDLDSALTQTYKVSNVQLNQLGDYLWGSSFIKDIKLINSNPIENIVSCKRIPFDVPAGVPRNIVLGNLTSDANGNIVSSLPIIDVGSIKYDGYYGNFLDYSPYTRLILFLPFCGFTEVDPSVVTGKTLSIKYAIDVILGKCRAMLFVDGAYYASHDGDFGVDIPLTGSNRAQVEAGLVMSALGTVATMAASPAAGTAELAVTAIGGLESATAAQYHSTRTGSYSSTCAWQETRKCFMIADIPTCQYPSSYAHDKGYPCMLTRTLATMNGFTKCAPDIDMKGLTCTEEEMDMIKSLLTEGIYL